MTKYLNEFKINEQGIVKKIEAEGKIKRRLFDMGVTPGTEVVLRKHAPLGDPIEVTIRGYELTLRKDEANKILMEVNKEVNE
ncbi:MAG: FeoA family protein [Bacilli bacterium]|nr:ferrous iron transport protein A [Bacilli bacterium]MDD7314840.1 FeoA family protein [Bacilli bacterium]MDY4053201.1 FeoA family protein [Bacilli bacterium]